MRTAISFVRARAIVVAMAGFAIPLTAWASIDPGPGAGSRSESARTGGTAGADVAAADRNLPENQPPGIREQVTYSFNENFAYAFLPDSTYYGSIEHFRALYPDAYWDDFVANVTNEDGSLAWKGSRDMMALVVLYDTTEDPWYLDRLSSCAEAVIAARDDLSGKKDEDGRSSPGWGSSRYGEGQRRIYLVHTGLIVEPVLEWALRAGKRAGRSQQDESKRTTIIDRCRETLLWHDYQLEPNPPLGEAVYCSGREEKERKLLWQPFNRQNTLARDFYLLYQLTGDESFRERSRRLYTFFKDRIERTPSDAYIWEYEPIKLATHVQVSACEDLSHASYSLEAVLHACRDNFVFERDDLGRFARTFTRYIHLGGGVFQSGIGCTAFFSPRYMDRLYAWLPFTEADPQIYPLVRSFLLHNVQTPPAEAIAFLIAYRPKGMSEGGGATR